MAALWAFGTVLILYRRKVARYNNVKPTEGIIIGRRISRMISHIRRAEGKRRKIARVDIQQFKEGNLEMDSRRGPRGGGTAQYWAVTNNFM